MLVTEGLNSRIFTYLRGKKKVQDGIKAKRSVPNDDALALGVVEAQLWVLRTQQQNEIFKAV